MTIHLKVEVVCKERIDSKLGEGGGGESVGERGLIRGHENAGVHVVIIPWGPMLSTDLIFMLFEFLHGEPPRE